MGVYLTFGLTRTFDGARQLDESQPTRKVKAPKGDIERARRKLPPPPLGREWIVVLASEGKEGS
jgi:hypothetical protein